MSQINNRQAICDTLLQVAENNKNLLVACSDSRGSGAMTPFAERYPEQFVEVGIAEQDLVSISAGLAACGKTVFAVSPASFLSTRSYEQVKVDVAYTRTNVKLVGISAGVSYGALGMTHHSCQDFAAMCALPDMRVYAPSDRFQTAYLTKMLANDDKPAYIRVSRNASVDIYDKDTVFEGGLMCLSEGTDVAILACGETVAPALNACKMLAEEGISCTVVDVFCLKPMDKSKIVELCGNAKIVVTVEEHCPYGGLGSIVAQVVSEYCPKKVINLSLPDEHLVAGTAAELFDYYGLNAESIAARVKKELL